MTSSMTDDAEVPSPSTDGRILSWLSVAPNREELLALDPNDPKRREIIIKRANWSGERKQPSELFSPSPIVSQEHISLSRGVVAPKHDSELPNHRR